LARAVALCASPQRLTMGERALGFAAGHRGAAARMARTVLQVLLRGGAARPPEPGP
jgi:hypothetical protein